MREENLKRQREHTELLSMYRGLMAVESSGKAWHSSASAAQSVGELRGRTPELILYSHDLRTMIELPL